MRANSPAAPAIQFQHEPADLTNRGLAGAVMPPSWAVEFFERMGHTVGIHGWRNAVMTSLLGAAAFVAGYWVTRDILKAVGLHRKRR